MMIYIVSMISDLGIRVILEYSALKILVIGELLTMIGAGIAVVAEVFGLVGMLLAGIWLVKPAKRRYVPALPAEDVAEATCENGTVEAVTEQESADREVTIENGTVEATCENE